MRRRFSILCLLAAWLCANGAVWNVVQVVAWVKMFHEYSQIMPLAKALERTFDGSDPCNVCVITQDAQDTAREQLPHEATQGSSDKWVLVCSLPAVIILPEPETIWPSIGDDVGRGRTELVPVPPPRV